MIRLETPIPSLAKEAVAARGVRTERLRQVPLN